MNPVINDPDFASSGDKKTEAQSSILGLYRELAKDHKNMLSKMDAGKIYHVGAEHNGLTYKIYNISVFDAKLDQSKSYLTVSGRSMQDAALFYLSCSRDFLINLRVMSTRKRSFLIEPRLEAANWNAKKLGLGNRKQLANLILGGGLAEILTADSATIRKKQKSTVKLESGRGVAEKSHKEELLETELANIRARELAILYQLNRYSMLEAKLKDDRIRWQDNRILELRQYIISNDLQIPAPASPQGRKYMLKSR